MIPSVHFISSRKDDLPFSIPYPGATQTAVPQVRVRSLDANPGAPHVARETFSEILVKSDSMCAKLRHLSYRRHMSVVFTTAGGAVTIPSASSKE